MKARYQLNRNDAIYWLDGLEPESVDLIITDPAYASLEKHRKRGTTTRLKKSKASSNEWFPIFPNERYKRFFACAYRVLKKNTHLYVKCDVETMFLIKPIAESVGFRFWNELVWDKQRRGMGYHYAKRTERILFFEKGKRNLNSTAYEDLLSFPRVNNGYPTEKPAELSEVFVLNSSKRGQLVIDPFMGSGSVGEAALRNGRAFWGNDIQAKAVRVAKKRFEKLGFTPLLTAA